MYLYIHTHSVCMCLCRERNYMRNYFCKNISTTTKLDAKRKTEWLGTADIGRIFTSIFSTFSEFSLKSVLSIK